MLTWRAGRGVGGRARCGRLVMVRVIGEGYNFSLNFVIDSDFETTADFYDEQLPARGWG